jgi:hypothetical protein
MGSLKLKNSVTLQGNNGFLTSAAAQETFFDWRWIPSHGHQSFHLCNDWLRTILFRKCDPTGILLSIGSAPSPDVRKKIKELKMRVYRSLALSLIVAAAAGYATVSSAQGLTRADVRADLIRVEQAGYSPSSGDDVSYPARIQAAEAKLAAQAQQQTAKVNDAMGGAPMGTSAAGTRVTLKQAHQQECVGPESYCNVYFGS